jgi:hypothetical protein
MEKPREHEPPLFRATTNAGHLIDDKAIQVLAHLNLNDSRAKQYEHVLRSKTVGSDAAEPTRGDFDGAADPCDTLSQAPSTANSVPIMQGHQTSSPSLRPQELASSSQADSFAVQEKPKVDRNIDSLTVGMSSNTRKAPAQQQTRKSIMLIPEDVLLSLCQDWINAEDLQTQLPWRYAHYNKKKITKMLRFDGYVSAVGPYATSLPRSRYAEYPYFGRYSSRGTDTLL